MQEADCSGSNQCDRGDQGSQASLQDGLIFKEDEVSAVSENLESGESFVYISRDGEGTKEDNPGAGAIRMDDGSVSAGTVDKVDGTHEVVDLSISAEAEGTPDTVSEKCIAVATVETEGTDEMVGSSVYPEEKHEVGTYACTDAGMEERTLEVVGIPVSDEVNDGPVSGKSTAIATIDTEGANNMDGVSVFSEESQELGSSVSAETTTLEERSHEVVDVSISVSDEATNGEKEITSTISEKVTEVPANITWRTNEMDGIAVCLDESHKVSAYTDSDREERTLPEEAPEETTHNARETSELGDVSVPSEARQGEEATHRAGGCFSSAHAVSETVLALDTPLYENSDVGEHCSAEGNHRVASLFDDSETERKQGVEADKHQSNQVHNLYKHQSLREKGVVVLVTQSQEKPLEAKREVFNEGMISAPLTDMGLVDFYQLVELVQGLDEEEFRNLVKSRMPFSEAEAGHVGVLTIVGNEFADNLESLKQQLYFSNVAKYFFHLQLAEQIELQREFDERNSHLQNEVFKLHSLLEKTRGSNMNLSEELAQCRSDIHAMGAGREELETQLFNARGEFEEITSRAFEAQSQMERMQEEIRSLSVELVDCRGLLEALETEKANINGSLIALTEARKKLEEEKDNVAHENEGLSAQLFEYKENMAVENGKRTQLELDLNDAMMRLEQLTEENIFLSSSLDVHKAKIKEIKSGHLQLFSHDREAGYQVKCLTVPNMVHKHPTDGEYSQQSFETYIGKVVSGMGGLTVLSQIEGSPLEPLEGEHFDESAGLLAFKVHLEEAQKTMQQLEKAIEGMHSHSVSLSKSGNKIPGAGVSKLIQAFESKVHHDDNGPEEITSPLGERMTDDRFKLATEQTSILRAILKELELRAEKANQVFKEEQEGRKVTSMALGEIHVLYEGSKKHIKNLEAKNTDVVNKLSEYQSRADHLCGQLCTIQQSSDEMSSSFLDQVETLQKEVGEKTAILEQEWNSTIGVLLQTVEKLEASTGRLMTATNSTAQSDTLDVSHRIGASVDAAIKLIEELHQKLEALHAGNQTILKSYESLNENFCDLHVRNEVAAGLLRMIYSEVRKLLSGSCDDVRGTGMDEEDDQVVDILQPINYINLMDQLGKLLSERLQLKFAKIELESNLKSRIQEVEELNERCIDPKSILKLVEDVKSIVKLDEIDICSDQSPVSHLEYLINVLLSNYKEANEQVSVSREEFGVKLFEMSELKGEMHQLSSLNSQQEDEIHTFKEKLREMEGNLEALHSELQVKGTELEQSEQRLCSIREKLSIAVAKGKGLIVQRDNLKQSLSDMSAELDRCSQELQSKDTKLHEVETKLKTYSEAGERIEALESELSYIRNSATTLRESFLLKDSVIQRIEEILEDLELPEHFHSRHIIEKVEWLAKSVTGNSLPITDWDQKSSVGGGSYSDGGFVVMDGWKDDLQSSSDPGLEDLKRKYEDLQGKFYGMAEQNEMLEQSLMERNDLVRRWEVVLDRIDMPLQLRSMEPEERIGWLGSALYEAHNDRDSLHQKIENVESYCRSLTADLEESQRKISELEVTLQAVEHERDLLSESVENLSREHENVLKKSIQYEFQNDGLRNEVTSLQEKLGKKIENTEYLHQVGGEIKRLHVLVSDALQDLCDEDLGSSGSDTERLEGSLRKLIDNYMALLSEKPVCRDIVKEHHAEESDVGLVEQINDDAEKSMEQDRVILKEELVDALRNLALVKEERDNILEKHQTLVVEFEALVRQRDDLQEKLSQEEQKLISTRDKLNIAVRKGKGLVQQRDGLKQTIEEMNTHIDRLKNDLNQRENALMQYEQKINDLSIYPEKVEALEHECLLSRNRLTELEHNLQDCEHILSGLLNTLSAIDIDTRLKSHDPISKMEEFGKLYHDLQAALASSEHETKISKRATELLLAELNEVNERADGLQDELSKVEEALAGLSKERDVLEVAKNEAISHLEKASTVQAEERKRRFEEVIKLTAGIDQLRKGCFGFTSVLPAVFSTNMELLRNVEAGMESLLRHTGSNNVVIPPVLTAPGDMLLSNSANEVKLPATATLQEMRNQEHFDDSLFINMLGIINHNLQECSTEIDVLREICHRHSISSDQQAKSISKVMEAVNRETGSQKKSLELMERDIASLELIRKEKDAEVLVLQRHLSLLYKACTDSIYEIENQKFKLSGNGSDYGIHALRQTKEDLGPPISIDGQDFAMEPASFTEEGIKTIADTLSLAVKDSAKMQAGIIDGSQKELKAIIHNLQRELQEKDIQRNRVCAELVSQIQEAEASAKSYSVDLESAKVQVKYLETQMETMEKERSVLELRIEELQHGEGSSIQLQGRVASLTDSLNAKGQEIEDLMQALDEEESQIEGLTNKVEELEKILQEKNLVLENLEASRGKAITKLSTTLSKFDELHKLSQSLLSEVENLQSQLQNRDAEISFLRQEVTRCTGDVLTASQVINKRNSTEMHDLLTWFGVMTSYFEGQDVRIDDNDCNLVEAYKEILEKQIISLISESKELRDMAQSKDSLLQVERRRVQELLHKAGTLENSLSEKELHIASLQDAQDPGDATSLNSEIAEVEPMISKRSVSGASVAPHIRSMRKLNSDQVAIDMDPDVSTLDEDDDKVHGFKSLTTSRIVPRFTRPVSDMIDGLWVSCDRALMRQPALRLGIMLYWFVLHTLLATSMV